jgi:hypothetical protein
VEPFEFPALGRPSHRPRPTAKLTISTTPEFGAKINEIFQGLGIGTKLLIVAQVSQTLFQSKRACQSIKSNAF